MRHQATLLSPSQSVSIVKRMESDCRKCSLDRRDAVDALGKGMALSMVPFLAAHDGLIIPSQLTYTKELAAETWGGWEC